MMGNVTVFVDESGNIAKNKEEKSDYFIIAMLFVKDEDLEFVHKLFKKYRLQAVKKKSWLMEELRKNGEIKGSALTEAEKRHIYRKLFGKCRDKCELGIIVMDNKKATEKFRSNSSRAFNYLLKLYLQEAFPKSRFAGRLDNLKFVVDERNVAKASRVTLQEYLNTELNLTSDFCKGEIVVHYYDSRRFLFVQMADLIANTFFRKYQNKRDGNDNVALLMQWVPGGEVFRYPRQENSGNKRISSST